MNWNAFKNVSITSYDPTSVVIIDVDAEMKETVHPVQFVLGNLPDGYRLTTSDRASIAGFVKQLLRDNLDNSLELIEVASPGYTPGGQSLPLNIKVEGPKKDADVALVHIMEALENHKQDLARDIKSLDWTTYKQVSVSIATFNPASVTVEPEVEAVTMKETVHPVQLVFGNVLLSATDRASIIRYVKELLDDNLVELDLVSITLAATGNKGASSLPLDITVKGPADESSYALSYIMDVLEGHEDEIVREVKSMDWDAYKNVVISITDTHDFVATEPSPSVVDPGAGVVKETEETVHPIQLTLNNVPDSYQLSVADRADIIRYVKEVLEKNINQAFRIIRVAYVEPSGSVGDNPSSDVMEPSGGGNRNGNGGNPGSLVSHNKNNGRRRLDTISLPLLIFAKGPADLSDIALTYIMDALEENMPELLRKLKSLDWNAYKNVAVTTSSYDPAKAPEVVEMKVTEHPVQLVVRDVITGHRLSAADRAKILRFVQGFLDDDLDDSLELVSVEYEDKGGNQRSRRLGTLALPLRVTVKSPKDQSEYALSYIMDAFEENEKELLKLLKSMDWNSFKDGDMSTESYEDFASMAESSPGMEETEHPVQLTVTDVLSGYRLSRQDRMSIISFVKGLLEDYLDDPWSLVQVAYAGSEYNRRLLVYSRRLENLVLPLLVNVRGPVDESDLALPHLTQTLRDHVKDIESYLKMTYGEAFMVRISMYSCYYIFYFM